MNHLLPALIIQKFRHGCQVHVFPTQGQIQHGFNVIILILRVWGWGWITQDGEEFPYPGAALFLARSSCKGFVFGFPVALVQLPWWS